MHMQNEIETQPSRLISFSQLKQDYIQFNGLKLYPNT